MMKTLIKRTFKIAAYLGLTTFIILLVSSAWIDNLGSKNLYQNINNLPGSKTCLLLGTSAKARSGRENLFFKYRINTAAELYKKGKIEYILVSGDNSTKYYNEPADMREALMELGVPSDRIILDYAGFRTFDSVIRCKEVFNQNNFIIVSQAFHVKRALAIAHFKDIQAYGFPTQDIPSSYSLKTMLREFPARLKVLLDVFIFNTEPKYLGEPQTIG